MLHSFIDMESCDLQRCISRHCTADEWTAHCLVHHYILLTLW